MVLSVRLTTALALLSVGLLVAGCRAKSGSPPSPSPGEAPAGLVLASPAFAPGAPIPRKYTCDGDDVSPPLSWTNAPTATQAFALVVADPDAPGGTWIHWVIFDIPGTATGLSRAIPPAARLPDGSVQGVNSWGQVGYGGPCPPEGGRHRYLFRLYALDTRLERGADIAAAGLMEAMEGHVLAQAELMGVYRR